MSHVVAITGSPSTPSRTAALVADVAEHLRAHGHTVEEIDVRGLPARALVAADVDDPVIAAAIRRVEAADGIIVATPVFKASYSGALKTFLDALPQRAFEGKTVLPLATAGSAAHVLVLDYALRPVLNSLGADHITPGWVGVAAQTGQGVGSLFSDSGTRGGALERALDVFLDSITATASR